MKNVQIPEELLYALFRYFLVEPDENTEDSIKRALEAKLDAIVKHNLYTQSKTAESPAEREKARQEYLDRVGMRDSFRWSAAAAAERSKTNGKNNVH